jgi:hypothetical protein
MPLFACPVCGRHNSTAAEKCAHCAHPFKGAESAPKSTMLTRETIKDEARSAATHDLMRRELLLEHNGELHYFRFAGDGTVYRGDRPGACLSGDGHYTMNWPSGLLFIQTSAIKGHFLLLAGKGRLFLLAPAGYVEHILYQA